MADRDERVSVTILGTKYRVVSDRDEAYVHELAEYVNQKLDRFVRGPGSTPLQQRIILAALNIADELFRARTERRDLLKEIGSRSERLIATLEAEGDQTPDELE